jgi:hypothetical protein
MKSQLMFWSTFTGLFLPIHTFEGEAAGGRFGASVAGLGDVSGDGFADVAVGAPHADPNGPSSGLVRVFSGRDGSELWRLEGDSDSDWFGFSIDAAGDVDGDGIGDLVIGSPLGTPPEGSATVVSGRDGATIWVWSGEAPGERFGHSVAGAGDVNGDGFADVIVGAPHANAGGTFAGRARVFSGADGSVLHSFDGFAWDQLGFSVGGAGDIDGDGRADVVVGAPLADSTAFNSGSAFVFSGADGSEILAVHGVQIGDQLGSVVHGAGDVNADGKPDFLVGIPAADVNAIDSGAVEVRSGADGSVWMTFSGQKSGEFLHQGAGVGDVDGDGFDDVALGSPAADGKGSESGKVRLHSGKTGAEMFVASGRVTRDWLGADVAAAGDVNGDGRLDFIAGAPGHDDELEKKGYAQVFWVSDTVHRPDRR